MQTKKEKAGAVEPMVVTVTCSFCEKPKSEVGLMVVATRDGKIAICDACIVLCCEILSHEHRKLRKREEVLVAEINKKD